MVLDQTLALAKNIVICTPRGPLVPTFSPNPLPPIRLFCSPAKVKNNRRLSIHGGVKCWTENNNYIHNNNGSPNGSVEPQYPRPSDIPWSKDIANCVQLIGTVTSPVQTKQFESGKSLALVRLHVLNSPTDFSWIQLLFWDDLAHTAAQHVEQGQKIYVSGRLTADTVKSEDGKKRVYYKVNVNQLHFIENSFPTASMEQLWQAFFANPVDWWDNRKSKRNPNAPDFKHKDTGEALWIQGRSTPLWVDSQLEILDTRMESIRDPNDGMHINFDVGDDYKRY